MKTGTSVYDLCGKRAGCREIRRGRSGWTSRTEVDYAEMRMNVL